MSMVRWLNRRFTGWPGFKSRFNRGNRFFRSELDVCLETWLLDKWRFRFDNRFGLKVNHLHDRLGWDGSGLAFLVLAAKLSEMFGQFLLQNFFVILRSVVAVFPLFANATSAFFGLECFLRTLLLRRD